MSQRVDYKSQTTGGIKVLNNSFNGVELVTWKKTTCLTQILIFGFTRSTPTADINVTNLLER